VSLVFQNIEPPPPSLPGECVPPPLLGGRTHSPGGEGGGGSIFWKTRDIGLPSYSNNLSRLSALLVFVLSVAGGIILNCFIKDIKAWASIKLSVLLIK
jgi:hypothetical protein